MDCGIKRFLLISLVLLMAEADGCSLKRKPLVPLALTGTTVSRDAIAWTEEGTKAYQAKQFEEAKRYFAQAMAAAPDSGQAHYNYALALNALGEAAVARHHFLEAANLAPGDKVIWDSPALAPYGDPEIRKQRGERPYGTGRPTFGGMSR
jgi:tetratricopeptide (TPR) repeat protein